MNDGDVDVGNYLKLTNLWPPAETEEDKDFIRTSLYEFAGLYSRIVTFLRWSTLICTLFGFTLIHMGFNIMIVWFVVTLLVGFLTFFLPSEEFVRKALFYWYERKMRDNNEGCMGGMSPD